MGGGSHDPWRGVWPCTRSTGFIQANALRHVQARLHRLVRRRPHEPRQLCRCAVSILGKALRLPLRCMRWAVCGVLRCYGGVRRAVGSASCIKASWWCAACGEKRMLKPVLNCERPQFLHGFFIWETGLAYRPGPGGTGLVRYGMVNVRRYRAHLVPASLELIRVLRTCHTSLRVAESHLLLCFFFHSCRK